MKSKPQAFRAARERAGHNQATLSKAAGVSQSRISDYEAEPCDVRPTTAKRIADALGVDIEDIATITDEAVAG